jgi:hypothetical protein
VNDLPVNVRQPKVSAAVPICEPLMIEAEQIQDCGVEIVNVDRLFSHLISTRFIHLWLSE